MAQKVIGALGRLRGRLRSGPGDSGAPMLSVVVPVFDAGERLAGCLDSLLAQDCPRLEIIVVDDGSTDDSLDVMQDFAERHPHVQVVRQEHRGVGAARNTGAQAASGEYVAFCDADDVVPGNGYARLVRALETSGSDLAVGSVTVQRKGRHVEPEWARRSNAARRLGQSVDDVPELMENLLLGCRVFRTSFWRDMGLSFDPTSQHAGVVTVVEALLRAGTVDVLPAVVYRWHWREDGRSLLQRSLVDRDGMADRVAQLGAAGELLGSASEPLRRSFFSGVLHTEVPDLVRSAVARADDYWSTLSERLARLLDSTSPETLAHVPVEDRLTVWLCARDLRAVTERFLEYAFDNHFGYPFRAGSPRPLIALPFIDEVEGVSDELLMVAPADMPFRTRLTALRWLDERRLYMQGGAFIEYVDDDADGGVVELVLVDRGTGVEVRIPTRPDRTVEVDHWAGRANEDHGRSGFSAVIDVSSLALEGRKAALEVQVDLTTGPHHRRGPFQSRRVAGSAGLMETLSVDGFAVTPAWRPFDGLRLLVDDEPAGSSASLPGEAEGARVVEMGGAPDGVLTLQLADVDEAPGGAHVALVGPRSRSPWVPVERNEASSVVELPLHVDEWGLGEALLPEDRYDVRIRSGDLTADLSASKDLWRTLPRPLTVGDVEVAPLVSAEGRLAVEITPVELRRSRGQYQRRRLRDGAYPAARQQPLLDVVLFETFAGKAAGDNPGAVCSELARRDTGLDLVFSVVDRSVQTPAGCRAVVRWTEEWLELLGRARYLVTNTALPYFFRKRDGQLYVQTWHGTPLKRIAHDRPHVDFLNWHHSRQLLRARDDWDYLLSQSAFCTHALTGAFRYEGPVLELGYPRNDVLLSADADVVRRRVREHFAIAESERVVLYAPTWRDNLRVGRVWQKVVYLETERLVQQLPDTVVLVRGHYNSVGAAEVSDPDRRVIDVTRYPDIGDLYLAADALVTDYSSVFFDFAITDKPMVFLAPDLVEYRDDNRGFYLDYHETVPGPVCVTTDEVVDVLSGPDEHGDRRARFRQSFNYLDDGAASARTVDAILRASEDRAAAGQPTVG